MVTGIARAAVVVAAMGTLAVACGWATIGNHLYACVDNACPEGRICRPIELGDGAQSLCVPPGKKPLIDGGTTDTDGGSTLIDGGFVFEDGGTLDSGAVDAGSLPGCGTLTWDFDGGVFVRGYPADLANYNVFFLTSGVIDGNLGGFDGGDSICRAYARDAGFWSPETYVAYLSEQLPNNFGARFRSTVGFIRPDGLPLAPSLGAMHDGNLWYPPTITERRAKVLDTVAAWSGMGLTIVPPFVLTAKLNCSDWTTSTLGAGTAFHGSAGQPFSTSQAWQDDQINVSCDRTRHVYCAQLAGTCAPPTPLSPPGARLAFVTDEVTFDQAESACDPYAADSGRTYRPLLTHLNAHALGAWSRADGGLVPALDFTRPPWVRADGVVVTAQAVDLAADQLFAPIDYLLAATGRARVPTNGRSVVWTGASAPTKLGTASTTCGNWSVAGETARVGDCLDASQWFALPQARACDPVLNRHRVYCLEP